MKLLVVGSSPQSNIYLGSQYVSGYHADIIILDNGDIMVSDRSSTNGTFLNGSRLAPNIEVLVKRGDNVVFADTTLDWSMVPDVRVDPNTKKLIGIGSHSRNQIHISGSKASRFHATIKQTNDGKWFICDHSTNGTTVNNVRIPKDAFVRLKAKDVIKCAGIPVENPVPSDKKWWIYSLACACVACVVGFVAYKIINNDTDTKPDDSLQAWVKGKPTPTKIYQAFAPSTVIIYMGYHYKVTAGSLDVVSALGTDEFVVGVNGREPYLGQGTSMQSFATGFYISPDGKIATNLHVACPWLYDGAAISNLENWVRAKLTNLSMEKNIHYSNYVSQVKVEGVVDFMYAIPHGQYFDGHTAMSCIQLAASANTNIDVAVLQAMLPGKKLQDGAKYISLKTIPGGDAYISGSDLCTIGFPGATDLQNIAQKDLEAIYAGGTMSSTNQNYNFGHNATSTNGASGSPVLNMKGELIGVISSGYALANGYNFAVRAEQILLLLQANGIKY